jgi:hypothetical protein
MRENCVFTFVTYREFVSLVMTYILIAMKQYMNIGARPHLSWVFFTILIFFLTLADCLFYAWFIDPILYWCRLQWQRLTHDRPDLSSERAPQKWQDSNFKKKSLGSTPRHTDWLTVSRNVTLTLTWWCPTVNYRPVLSSERELQHNKQ